MTASRRHFLRQLGGSALGLAGSSFLVHCGRTTKPNVIFFLVDDLGWADLGCYGSSFHQSPNIDRLAANGMRFTQAYAASPVCSPTRASIMTGKHPARLGVTNWLPGRHQLPYSKLIAPESKQEVALEEVTIAEELKAAGYRTAYAGKWHMGGRGHYPENQGFDRNVGGNEAGSPKSFFYPDWEGRPPITAEPGEYLTDRLTRDALRFIEENRDAPFFLYFADHNVHIPLEAKKEYTARYEAKIKPGLLQKNPIYAGMIQSVDESVGSVMQKLEPLGIADRTIVIFLSGNGGLHVPEWRCMVPTSNSPLREGKGHLDEGGIREPMIIHWPGVTKPGSVCDVPVVSTDFYPTMVEMAGISRPIGNPVDGRSLVSLLKQAGQPGRDAIYWHYPHYSNQGGKPAGAIRQGDHKLIEFYEDGRLELYNIREDIGEKTDRAARLPEKVKQLRWKLEAWRRQMNAALPAANPKHDPAREWEGVGWKQKCV